MTRLFRIESKYNKLEDISENKTTGWLCTFNDMMTLLMVFFVLIFSLSTMDELDIQSARLSLQSGLGIFEAGNKTSIGLVQPLTSYDIKTETFTKQLENSIENLNSNSDIAVTYTDEGIIITLDDEVLFDTGSDDITSDGFLVLDKISAEVLNKISNSIRIEGHTDTDPIHNEKFPSNWELSISRSVNVLKYLTQNNKILPKRMSAVGYGEAKPLFPNDTAEHKSRNRRVEVVIISNENV